MTTIRVARHRVPMCPGCGLYPHTHNWEHRPDCAAQQISDHQALTNIAEIFGPHLTPQSAAELHRQVSANHGGEKGTARFTDDAPARRTDRRPKENSVMTDTDTAVVQRAKEGVQQSL